MEQIFKNALTIEFNCSSKHFYSLSDFIKVIKKISINNNVAIVALANKIARICFVILNKDQEYIADYDS